MVSDLVFISAMTSLVGDAVIVYFFYKISFIRTLSSKSTKFKNEFLRTNIDVIAQSRIRTSSLNMFVKNGSSLKSTKYY